MRKRVTYRPGKAQGTFGVIWGGLFVLIGLFVVIPAFGPFGLLWTFGAAAITAMNAYQTFGKKYAGPEIHIENLDGNGYPQERAPFSPDDAEHNHSSSIGPDPKVRMERLEALKQAGLITEAEYREKRREILEKL